jgi:hypothetical protein
LSHRANGVLQLALLDVLIGVEAVGLGDGFVGRRRAQDSVQRELSEIIVLP